MDDRRGASPLVGNLLLVAVAIVVASLLALLSFTLLDATGTPTADAKFEYERTPVGVEMKAVALGTDVVVRLNGERVATFEADAAGRRALIPTAPGDRIVVVSRDEDRSVLVEKEVDDRDEVGNFVAYYPFDGSGSTVEDRSGNGNDGTLKDDGGGAGPTRAGCGLSFDGEDDHVLVEDISSPVDVEEFTVAVAFVQQGAGNDDVSQLVEHTWSGNEWFIENRYDGGRGAYRTEYAVEYPNADVASSYDYTLGEKHVAVGTYDGDEYSLYVDGTQVASGSHSRAVDMGDMRMGRDFESSIQYLDGVVCEVRLYYSAFDSDEVQRLSDTMS
jgi:flagellin-like protein